MILLSTACCCGGGDGTYDQCGIGLAEGEADPSAGGTSEIIVPFCHIRYSNWRMENVSISWEFCYPPSGFDQNGDPCGPSQGTRSASIPSFTNTGVENLRPECVEGYPDLPSYGFPDYGGEVVSDFLEAGVVWSRCRGPILVNGIDVHPQTGACWDFIRVDFEARDLTDPYCAPENYGYNQAYAWFAAPNPAREFRSLTAGVYSFLMWGGSGRVLLDPSEPLLPIESGGCEDYMIRLTGFTNPVVTELPCVVDEC